MLSDDSLLKLRDQNTKELLVGAAVYLQWEDYECDADEDDHHQLGGPDLRRDVAVAHGGEGDDAEIKRVKQGQVAPGSL